MLDCCNYSLRALGRSLSSEMSITLKEVRSLREAGVVRVYCGSLSACLTKYDVLPSLLAGNCISFAAILLPPSMI
jgi:hypothetical protein